ncbi:unnamed protein product [Rhodiola kirilowii]
MENITASEMAGLGVGTLLLCATIAAPKIDSFISASQRSSLGMCKRCGDLKLIACSTCKGVGSVTSGGIFGFITETKSVKCMKCQARGHFICPDCS